MVDPYGFTMTGLEALNPEQLPSASSSAGGVDGSSPKSRMEWIRNYRTQGALEHTVRCTRIRVICVLIPPAHLGVSDMGYSTFLGSLV